MRDELIETVRSEFAELAAKRPKLRGVSHQWATLAAIVAGGLLVWKAPDGRATVVAVIYAVSLVGLFAVSAVYHRITWRPNVRRWMRRLDHSMIYVFMAGSATPIALLVVGGTLGTVLLCIAWGGAVLGVVLNLAWIDAPRMLKAMGYVALGWVGIIALPKIISVLGLVPTLLFLIGGLFYTVGAVIYAKRRPDPVPRIFGYHEVFHALVILAAAVHFAAVAGYVVPLG
ncbi:hemolysin III family protein [Conexibacter sp. CPCC 206217]|uniref:PAQR family membrane homeostasis protein TrhA n=1 Tax=Conexibacter sp. CPCC 206217 TaxID=3064574 RepID=UPI00271C6DE2|nr:hemolysin III family protein [Conexibacter sp. CPCC 206217]MDO8209881.1 hemolysin III family protein [Conexibacter sp. CPCC 206217]